MTVVSFPRAPVCSEMQLEIRRCNSIAAMNTQWLRYWKYDYQDEGYHWIGRRTRLGGDLCVVEGRAT